MIVVIVTLALAACGGSGTISPNWDAGASRTAHDLAARIAHGVPGACSDYNEEPRSAYVTSAKRIHSPVPSAVGSCSALDETIEISVFRDATSRAAFVQRRAGILCARALKAHIALPGLRWVVGDVWSVQPDSEGVARRLAPAVGGRYQLTACPGTTQVDWDPGDAAHVQQLATELQRGGLGCDDFLLQNRDYLAHNPHYVQTGLPGAYGRCTVDGGASVSIAAFGPGATPLARFVPKEQVAVCAQAGTARVVIGDDWAAFVTHGDLALRIATALHGKPFGGACPQNPR